MADKRYDQFPAGSNDPAQIILTADPSTGELGKIPLSDLGGSQNLQDVTDVGADTTNQINPFGVSVDGNGAGGAAYQFNMNPDGTFRANGWAGSILQDVSGWIIIQPSFLSGLAGGSPSYSGLFAVKPNGTVVIYGLSVYADDAAAGVGGLTTGCVYQTSTGELRIKL